MDTKVGGEGEGRGAPGSRTQILLQTLEEVTMENISTPQPIEDPTPEK